jgi:hypothetical protein
VRPSRKPELTKICSASSSDMARPIIVTAVTTANGAHFGPGECHGMRPYSRRPGAVKRVVYHLAAPGSRNPGFSRAKARRSKPDGAAAILRNV